MWTVPRRSQLGRKLVISFIFTILCFNFMLTQLQASPSRSTNTSEVYPSLFVTKSVENTEITQNDSFVVTITIVNVGNSTAYNVTFIDTLNSAYVFTVAGLTKLSYSWIEPNQTRKFSYIITAHKAGDYQLHAAKVYYRVSEISDTEFLAYSNALHITVNDQREDFSLANLNSAITFLLVLVILNLILALRIIAPKFNRKKN